MFFKTEPSKKGMDNHGWEIIPFIIILVFIIILAFLTRRCSSWSAWGWLGRVIYHMPEFAPTFDFAVGLPSKRHQ